MDTIAESVGHTYSNEIPLTGMILMYAVDDSPSSKQEATRAELLKHICGKDAYRNIVTATTFRGDETAQPASEREIQRCAQGVWKDMIKAGARVMRHKDNRSSAIEIIRSLMDKKKTMLQMQQELNLSQGMLIGTTAGKVLENVIGEQIRHLIKAVAETSATDANKNAE